MSFSVTTVGDGVEVRESSIPGSGNGLWTNRPFLKNDLITEYCGKIIDHDKALKLRRQGRHSHVRVLNSHWLYIDGLKQPELGEGGASFANDARDPAINNAVFAQKFDKRMGRDRVFLKALCDMGAHQEVFVSYGNTYWDHADDWDKQQEQLQQKQTRASKRSQRQQQARSPAQQQQSLLEKQQMLHYPAMALHEAMQHRIGLLNQQHVQPLAAQQQVCCNVHQPDYSNSLQLGPAGIGNLQLASYVAQRSLLRQAAQQAMATAPFTVHAVPHMLHQQADDPDGLDGSQHSSQQSCSSTTMCRRSPRFQGLEQQQQQ